MNHLDEREIELYLLEAPEVENQREQIHAHLNQCEECNEIYETFSKYYNEVEQGLRSAASLTLPTKDDNRSRALSPVHRQYQDLHAIRQLNIALPARAARWIIHHPYVSAGSGAFAIGLAAILMILSPRSEIKKMNPDHLRSQNDSLLVYNVNNELLWGRYIGFEVDLNRKDITRGLSGKVAQIIDIDNDGINEVILIGGYRSQRSSIRDSIICFGKNGKMLWGQKLGRELSYSNQKFSDQYLSISFLARDLDGDGQLDLLAYAHHLTWAPSFIVRINPRNGSVEGEYVHFGHIEALQVSDIDGNGILDILLGGQNNVFDMASLVVLDPRKIHGFSPSFSEVFISDGIPGTEMYFLLFPRTDLGIKAGSHLRNSISELDFDHGKLQVMVVDSKNGTWLPLYYTFDQNFNCLKVEASDVFLATHKEMERIGQLRSIDGQYFENLRKRVLFWDGEKLVNNPIINRNYLESVARE